RGFKQFFSVIINRTKTLDISCAHLGVGVNVSFLKALQLNLARVIDPLADKLRRFAGVATGEILIAYRRHFDLNIDAIKQRPGYSRPIALDLQWRTDTFLLWVGEKAAGTRIHGSDEHDTGGIVDRTECAGDGDVAVFQGLPHDLKHVPPEFRKLVEK